MPGENESQQSDPQKYKEAILSIKMRNLLPINLSLSMNVNIENEKYVSFVSSNTQIYRAEGVSLAELAPGETKEYSFRVKYELFFNDSIRFIIGLIEKLNNANYEYKKAFKCIPSLTNIKYIMPDYTNPRLKAVSYYFKNETGKLKAGAVTLDSLVKSGDKKAKMWKGIFQYMGWYNYPVDEDMARISAYEGVEQVRAEADEGDLESIYLLYHAYDMNLIGINSFVKDMQVASNFLDIAADQGFDIANYERGLRYLNWASQNKNGALQNYKCVLANTPQQWNNQIIQLQLSYERGFKKCGMLIRNMFAIDAVKESGQQGEKVQPYSAGFYVAKWDSILNKSADWDYVISKAISDLNNSSDQATINEKVKWLENTAGKNHKNINAILYEYFSRSKITEDQIKAEKYLNMMTEDGDREALFIKGMMEITGMPEDGRFINNHYMKLAANKGHPLAMIYFARQFAENPKLNAEEYNATRFWCNKLRLNRYDPQIKETRMKKADEKFWSDWYSFSEPRTYKAVYYYSNGSTSEGYEREGALTAAFRGFLEAGVEWVFERLGQIQSGNEVIAVINNQYSSYSYDCYAGSMSHNLKTEINIKKGQKFYIYSDGEVMFNTGEGEWHNCGSSGVCEALTDGYLNFSKTRNAPESSRASILLNVFH